MLLFSIKLNYTAYMRGLKHFAPRRYLLNVSTWVVVNFYPNDLSLQWLSIFVLEALVASKVLLHIPN